MDRPKLEVADIFHRYGETHREQRDASLSSAHRRVITAIEVCRTAALGGDLERCDCCNHERPCYDSYRVYRDLVPIGHRTDYLGLWSR